VTSWFPLEGKLDPNAPMLEFIENSKFTSHSGSACVRLVLGACESLWRMKGSARGKRDLKVKEGEDEASTAVGIVGPGGEEQIYHVSLRGDCLSYQNYRWKPKLHHRKKQTRIV